VVNSGWTTPRQALDGVTALVGAPPAHLLERTSRVLHDLVPHSVAAQLSEASGYAPTQTVGADATLAARITVAELGEIGFEVRVGAPWQGEAVLGGERRRALGVASSAPGADSAMLVLAGVPREPVPGPVLETVQRLWDLVTVYSSRLAGDAYPERIALSRAAAAARGRALTEMADACTVSLTGVLGALRAPALGDAQARARATELAVDALARLRERQDWNDRYTEEQSGDAFQRLVRELRPLFQHGPVRLELQPPGEDRALPSEVVHAARAAVRSAVLALRERGGPSRMHVGWWIEPAAGAGADPGGAALRAAVRDDGDGRCDAGSLLPGVLGERVRVLGGSISVDAVPGWGTTVTVVLPLAPPTASAAPAHPLEGLHPRELEVLEQLTLGRRNRDIADSLGISPSTVKFHVANVLRKLGVSSRGEAAALARGLPS